MGCYGKLSLVVFGSYHSGFAQGHEGSRLVILAVYDSRQVFRNLRTLVTSCDEYFGFEVLESSLKVVQRQNIRNVETFEDNLEGYSCFQNCYSLLHRH